MGLSSIISNEFSSPSAAANVRMRFASRANDSLQTLGDTASFSEEALDSLSSQISDKDRMTSSSVMVELKDGSNTPPLIIFNNANGSISWGGNTLQLGGFANPLKDDLVIKKNADGLIEVYNLSTKQKMTLDGDGKQQLKDKKLDPASIVPDYSLAKDLSVGLFINNRGLASQSGNSDDVVINRQAGAFIDAGAGDDKIFNFSATASLLNGGGGNDSVYSVGLTSGTNINVASGNGYVKLLGNMTNGSISLGTGQNLVDASGMTLSGVRISDAAGAEASAVVAKTIANRSSVNLNAEQAAVDVRLLASSAINFGSGANSLVADQVSGKATDKSSITSKGINTYKLGTVAFADVNSANAVSDAIQITGAASDTQFNLSKGQNLLDATGKTLTAVRITSQQGEKSATTVLAGAIAGRNTAGGGSSIALAGSTAGNTIDVSKAISYTTINTGTGAGTVSAGSLSMVSVSMGGAESANEQHLNVSGTVTGLTYTGAKGKDTLNILGALSNSNINMGEGDNSFTTRNVSNTNITASSGSSTLNMGNYAYGATGNAISLGDGSNSITIGSISGKGTNGLRISSAATEQDQSLQVNGSANYLNYSGSKGADSVSILGAVANSNINLGEGENSFTARNSNNVLQKVSNTNITASGQSSTELNMGAYVYGANGNHFSLGSGANTINMNSISGSGVKGLKIFNSASSQDQTVNIYGSVNYLTYEGAAGTDNMLVSGAVSNSNINLGEGKNTFEARNNKSVLQTVSNTNISASGQSSTDLTMGAYLYGAGGNTISLGSGANTISMNSINGRGTNGLKIISAETDQNQSLQVNGAVNYLQYTGSKGEDDILVSGAVSNSTINLGEGKNSFTARNSNDVLQKVTNTNISASGQSATDLTMGAYVYGANGNHFSLGSGANTINMNSISGYGTKGLRIVNSASSHDQTVNILGSVNYLSYEGSAGVDDIMVSGAVSNSTINLGEGHNTFTARNSKGVGQTLTNTNIKASGEGTSNLDMGAYVYGVNGNQISLGSGANTISMNSIGGKGTNGLKIINSASSQGQTLNVQGLVNYLSYEGSAGGDDILVSGAVSNSTINLGEGNNNFTARNSNGVGQTVTNTNIKASGESTSNLDMGAYVYGVNGNQISLGSGANTISMNSINGKGTNGLKIINSASSYDQTLNVQGVVNYLSYEGSAGADDILVSGAVSNSTINLGEGNNSFTARNSNAVGQTVTNTNIKASGEGTSTLDMGAYVYGANGNQISLGSGANSINMNSISGSGTKGLRIVNSASSQGQSLNVQGAVNYLSYEGSIGGDDIQVSGAVNNSTINLGEGNNSFTANQAKTSVTDSTISVQGTGANTIIINSLNTSAKGSSKLNLGDGNDTVEIGTFGGNSIVNMGGGTDKMFTAQNANGGTVNSTGGGTFTFGGGTGVAMNFRGSTDAVTISVTNNLSGAKINLGDGTTHIKASGNPEATSSLTASTINAGAGKLSVTVDDLISSTINTNTSNASDNTILDMKLGGALNNSTINLRQGTHSISAGTISSSTINRTAAGSLLLESGDVSGSKLNLSGEGADTLNIQGNLDAQIVMGSGADTINVSGTLSGFLTTETDLALNSGSISKLSANLGGNNLITVAKTIADSVINASQGSTLISKGTAAGTVLDISGTKILAAGDLRIDANSMSTSTVSMNAPEGGTAALDLQLADSLRDSTVKLGAQGSIKTGTIQNSTILRTEAGSLLLDTGNIIGGSIALTGYGNETLNIRGNASANITFGSGARQINVGGTLSGKLVSQDELTLNAAAVNAMEMNLSGAVNQLNVSNSITSSNFVLGTGANTVGTANTAYQGLTFSSAGTNTLLGRSMAGSTISLGAEGKSNQVQINGAIEGSNINLYGGNNSIGGTATSLKNTIIRGTGAGTNTIEALSIGGGGIVLGESDDRVDIFGAIDDTAILLGGGNNTLRNTLTVAEAGNQALEQGSALNNRVNNATIILADKTNVYLGDVKGNTQISGTGTNNINIDSLTDSAVNASNMRAGYIGVGTVNGTIAAGLGGSIAINAMESGKLTDNLGQNSITVGTLGERAAIETDALLHSTTLHINTLEGTLNLGNSNYAGAKKDNLTLADPAWLGTVRIGGQQVTSAGIAAAAVDTSGFGKGAGQPVV